MPTRYTNNLLLVPQLTHSMPQGNSKKSVFQSVRKSHPIWQLHRLHFSFVVEPCWWRWRTKHYPGRSGSCKLDRFPPIQEGVRSRELLQGVPCRAIPCCQGRIRDQQDDDPCRRKGKNRVELDWTWVEKECSSKHQYRVHSFTVDLYGEGDENIFQVHAAIHF